jgi:hypothetical protein
MDRLLAGNDVRPLAAKPTNQRLVLDMKEHKARVYGVEAVGGPLSATAAKSQVSFHSSDGAANQSGSGTAGVLAITGDASDVKRNAILSGQAVRLGAETRRSPRFDAQADIPASSAHTSQSWEGRIAL